MVDHRRGTLRKVAIVGIILVLLSPAGIGAVAASSDESAVSTVRTVEEIRGHLHYSVAQFEDGNRAAAAEHTTEIVEELGPVVITEVATANETLANELEAAFQAAQQAATDDSPGGYADVVQNEVLPALERAEFAVVEADRRTNATFNANVVAGLLERADAEYIEGVSENGSIAEDMDYWAAEAYADRAAVRYEAHVKGAISEQAAEELDEMFASLESSMAGPSPPEDVTGMIESITHELAEYTGLEVKASGEGAAAIERIEADLHEAVEAYEAGNVDQAKSIVKQTYLSNFESVEGTLIENDPDLVEALEGAFNDELPGQMTAGAPVSEVRQKVESVEGKLHEAEEILATQDDTEIDLDSEGDQITTTEQAETTATEMPGFGVLGAIGALALIGLARFRQQ